MSATERAARLQLLAAQIAKLEERGEGRGAEAARLAADLDALLGTPSAEEHGRHRVGRERSGFNEADESIDFGVPVYAAVSGERESGRGRESLMGAKTQRSGEPRRHSM